MGFEKLVIKFIGLITYSSCYELFKYTGSLI